MFRAQIAVVTLAAATLVAAGCNETRPGGLNPPRGGGGGGDTRIEVNAAGIRDAARSNLSAVLVGLLEAREIAGGASALRGIDLPIGSAPGNCAGDGRTDPDGGGFREPTEPEQPCAEPSAEARAADWANDLVDRYFHEDDVETAETNLVTWRISAQRACSGGAATRSTPVGGSDGGGGGAAPPQMDPPQTSMTECERRLDANPLRIAVSARRDGHLDAELLAGANRTRLGAVTIHPGSFGVEIDLARALESFESLARAIDLEAPSAPTSMQGRVALRLTRASASSYRVELGVLRAIQIASTDAEAPYSIALAASDPAWRVEIDTARDRLVSTTDIRAVDVSAPLGAFFGSACSGSGPRSSSGSSDGGAPIMDPPEPERCGGSDLMGTIAIHLAGLRSTAVIDDDAVELSRVGLGGEAATVHLDGQPLMSLDLNPSAGRTVDLTAAEHADGVEARVSPSLEMLLRLQLARLASQIDDLPAWTHDEELRVTFDGAAAPTLIALTSADAPASSGDRAPGGTGGSGSGAPPPPDPEPEERPLLRVVSGVLSFRSRHAPLVTVPAGSCLFGEFGDIPGFDDESEPSDPLPGGGSNGGTGSGGSSGGGTSGPDDGGHPFERLQARPCP